MRRLLFLVVAALVLARPVAATCDRAGPPPSDEELFAKASAVFVGRVSRVEEAGTMQFEKMPPVPSVEGSFRIVEVLKGQPPADGKVRSVPFVFCGAPILAGVDYLFFLNQDNFRPEGTFIMADWETGTRPLVSLGATEKERQQHQLEKLRELSKQAPK